MRLNRRNFLSSLAGLASLATLPAGAANTTLTYQQVFQRPPRQARPWVRWWWPGGAVDDGELRREIRLLNAAGFGGAEIQAFNPAVPDLTVQERARLNDYANTAYFEHLKVCTDEAQAQGLQIDTTFGSAWPSGGGFAITPELALIELTPAVTSVRAPLASPIQVKIPPNTRKFGAMSALDARAKDPRVKDWRDRLAARQKIVAVVAIKSEAPVLANNKNFRTAVVKAAGKMDEPKGIVLTDRLGPDGQLDWVPPSEGTWQIVVFKQFVVDSSVMAGVGEGPQLVLDHFKRAAFEAHARRVGDPMAPGGVPARALRATFVDSLELMPDMYWSEDLLAQFQARRGYDLAPYLPHLLQPGWMEAWNQHTSPPYFDAGATGDRIRADYRRTLSELFIENFLQPFVEWNHRHGLQARLQAHGAPSDLLQSYGLADIPETEDLESGGDTHFMRLARAAANLYGRKLVGCESLCWPGKSFDITPAQWKARANLLIASGANALTMHGFPYALHKDAWPGWYPFAPSPFLAGFSSMISEANPLWNAIGELTGYIGRLQGVMQNSRNVVPVAVYLGEIGYFHGIEPASTTKLLDDLLESGYDYDRINDDSILKGRVTGRTLRTSGGATYAALVLPARDNLPAATAAQLARFAKAGLPVVFVDRPPAHATGYADHERQDGLVREAVQSALDAGARTVPAATLQRSLREAGVPANLTFTGTSCLFIEKVLDGRSAYFLHNPREQAASVGFTTRAKGFPELWDASNGTQAGLPFRHVDGATEIHVDIAAGGAALVVFTGKQAPPAMTWTAVDTIDLGRRQWTLDVQGHAHNGRSVTTRLMLDQLKDWSAIDGLADFSGQVTYGTEITLPPAWLERGNRVWIELGAVHDMATVSVAGGPQRTLVAAPFDADITSLLRPGPNKLEIRVFNSPNNAMIDPKKAGLKNLKQQPAGLPGPVHLVRKQRKAGL